MNVVYVNPNAVISFIQTDCQEKGDGVTDLAISASYRKVRENVKNLLTKVSSLSQGEDEEKVKIAIPGPSNTIQSSE